MTKAVLLVTFNRRDYLEQVFAAVARAQPPRLYLASDGPRDNKPGEREQVESIRRWMLDNATWSCEVKTRFLEKNSGGCGPGASGAITWFFQNEKDGIVLEDDCVPTQTFFRFCEECLERYAADTSVWHIAGYAPITAHIPESYYFGKTMHCWGWAGWADRWQHFNLKAWDYPNEVYDYLSHHSRIRRFWKWMMGRGEGGEIDTWDLQWMMTIASRKGLCVIPRESLVENIGAAGTHYGPKSSRRNLFKKAVDFSVIIHPKSAKLSEALSERIMTEHYCPRPILPVYFLQELLKIVMPTHAVDYLRDIRNRIINSFK